MEKIFSVCIIVSALWLSAILVVDGFIVVPGRTDAGRTTASSATRSTELYGRRVMKRGGLGSIDNDGSSSGSAATKTGPRRSTKQQRKAGSSRKKKGGGSGKSKTTATGGVSSAMSQDLAKFLEESSSGDGGDDDDNEVVGGGGGQNKKTRRSAKTKSDRRQKQSAKKVIDDARTARIDVVIDELVEVLGERTGNVRDILEVVEKLLKIPSDNNNMRRLLSAKSRSDYRLAWVGSDDALCHVGTGLHKVPLARMQEVFMNCLGRNRIEILEVISLIGPFPNVKNILQGTTTVSIGGGGDRSEVQIVMDKMIDGTGKQIDAGTEDNIRRVDLEVAFFDERAIVVVMPPEEGTAEPLDDDGKRVLVFVREDDIEEKLEQWRVNEIDLD